MGLRSREIWSQYFYRRVPERAAGQMGLLRDGPIDVKRRGDQILERGRLRGR